MAKGSRRKCANCGEENLLRYTECRNCGLNLNESASKRRKSKLIMGSIVVGILFMISSLGEVNSNTNNSVLNNNKANCTKYRVMAEKLNIRDDASTSSNVVYVANKGDTVCIYTFDGKWGQANNGWMSGKYLEEA